MPVSWKEIEQSAAYQSASPEDQALAKSNFALPKADRVARVAPEPQQPKLQSIGVQPERTFLGTAKDIGIVGLKGAIGVPEAAMGLADIVTGGHAGKLAEDYLGFKPKEAKEILSQELSPAQKFADKQVTDASGFVNTLKASIQNPSTIAATVGESVPLMLGGGVIGRGVGAISKTAPLIAGAIGEGAVSAGASAEGIRQETDSGLLTGKQAGMATASGALTSLIGIIGGRVAKKYGFDDIDTMLVGGNTKPGLLQKNIAGRIAAGGISEGVFEEMPQSIQETVWQNAALEKPLLEGVPESAAQGLITGGIMGAGANIISSPQQKAANDYEKNLQDKFAAIKSQGVDKIPASITELDRQILQNNQMLQNTEMLDALAAEGGYEITDIENLLTSQNTFNQELKTRLESELANPTPETGAVADDAATLETDIAAKQAQEAKVAEQVQALDTRIAQIKAVHEQIADPIQKNYVGDQIATLEEEKQALLNGPNLDQGFESTVEQEINHQTSADNQSDEESLLMEQLTNTAQDVQAQADITARQNKFTALKDQLAQDNANLYNAVLHKVRNNQQDNFTPEEAAFYAKYQEAQNNELKQIMRNKNQGKEFSATKTALDEYSPKLPPIESSSFKNEQQVVEPVQVDQAPQVSMQELESQLTINQQQLDAVAQQLMETTDPNERIALQQEGSALQAENDTLQAQWNEQYQAQDQVTQPEAGAEFQIVEPKFVKDSQGNDVIGYHGTASDPFNSFDDSRIQKFDHGWAGAGHYFTVNSEYAQGYANAAENTTGNSGRIVQARFTFSKPLYKNSSEYNQLLQEAIGRKSILNKEDGIKATESFKAAGYDAVIDGKDIASAFEINVFDSRNIHYASGQTEFQTADTEQTSTQLTLPDIQSMFLNQQVKQDADGTINIKFKNGKGVTFKSIQDAGQGFVKIAIETGQMSENGKILGITIGNDVLLDANFADNKTMWHENKHVLDNLGMVTKADDSALNAEFNKLRKAGKLGFELSTHKNPIQRMKENRANMFAQVMTDRAAYRGDSKFKAMIQRVMDFFQQMLALGQQSIAGLAREVESGKIYEREVNGKFVQTIVPQAEVAADQWYSAVAKAIDESNMQSAKAGRWFNQINNHPATKPTEMEWSGLTEWLKKDPQRKVTKQELQEWFAENQVQLEEVILEEESGKLIIINKALEGTGFSLIRKRNTALGQIIDSSGNSVKIEDIPYKIKKIIVDALAEFIDNPIRLPIYNKYKTAGGTDYKEFILTWPNKQASYRGDHYHDIINPVVTMRTQVRTRPGGTKFLHVEEVQSDWDQEGQKRGFNKDNVDHKKLGEFANLYKIPIADIRNISMQEENDLLDKADLVNRLSEVGNLIHGAKYTNDRKITKNPWTEKSAILAMKRMVRYAAEQGLDAVAWSGGDIQTNRWGSEGFQWNKNADGSFTLSVQKRSNGRNIDPYGIDSENTIKSRDDVYEIISDIMEDKAVLYSPVKFKEYLNKQTDKLWTRMQRSKASAITNLNDDYILGEIRRADALYSLGEDDPLIDNIDLLIDIYKEQLKLKLERNGLKEYKFIHSYDGWNLLKGDSTVAVADTPQEAFDKVNPGGTYFPRAEAFKTVYDEQLYNTLRKEFGNNKWGKPKFRFIEQDGLKLPSMEVTPRMKDKALRQGMSMFEIRENLKYSVADQVLAGLITKKTETNTPEFAEWFDRSVAKTPEDAPLIFYHGTDGVFDTFTKEMDAKSGHASAGLGHFFTLKKGLAGKYGQHVMPTYLKMTKPYLMPLTEAQSFTSTEQSADRQAELKAQGYDSIIIKTGESPYVVIFDSGQSKSIHNQGQWKDPDNIYFETREQAAQDTAAQPTEQKLTDKQYNESFAEKNNRVQDFIQLAKIRGHEAKLLFDKLTGSISTRLANANPMLRDKMRRLDFDTSQKVIKALRVAMPLLEITKKTHLLDNRPKMSPADKHAWDLARKQADTVKVKQLAERYGIVDQMEKLRDVLNDLRKQAKDVGYEVGFIDEYWPRIIKDQEGFLQATQGISSQPEFTNALKAKAESMGITLDDLNADFPEVRADVISSMILGHGQGMGGPGNIQSRRYDEIPKELEKFYMNSDAALMSYIYSMTKKIEARKFFGKIPPKYQAHKNAITKAQAELTKITNRKTIEETPEVAEIFADRVTELEDRIALHNESLEVYKNQRDYTENIGAYISELMIKGDLHKKDEKAVREILEARFNEHGTTGITNAYKNLAYIDVMGNPISALTQIGDLAWAAYVGKAWTPKGFSNTVQNTIAAAMNKSKITKEDLGFERIAQEFADGTTLGNAVNTVFKIVALSKMDSIGKEALINNALQNYQEQVKTPAGIAKLKKQIQATYGAQTNQLIADLQNNVPSDNVKMLLYSRVLDFQPAALSEMPEYYLKGGNGRVFYMLKTYTLKQMDVFRNEVYHELKSGDPKRIATGISNMTKLLAMLTLANAGADELKDYVLGKETNFKDNVIENFLTIGGASRYMRMQVTREGVGSAVAQKILPPFKFINSISSDARERIVTGDVEKGLRSIDSIPVGGKLYYWHYGRGAANKKTLAEKDFMKATKRFRKFQNQFEKAEDKRMFLSTNSDEFKQMKLHRNFQTTLNKNKAEITRLTKLKQTPRVIQQIGQLKNNRELFYDNYFKAAKNLTVQ